MGSSIDWPMAGNDRLIPASGTSSMIAAINAEPGTIGYSDAGAALDRGLDEAALKVEQSDLKEDFFLTSENALSKDGIAAALDAEGTNIPDSGDADWSGVDTINQVEVRLGKRDLGIQCNDTTGCSLFSFHLCRDISMHGQCPL